MCSWKILNRLNSLLIKKSASGLNSKTKSIKFTVFTTNLLQNMPDCMMIITKKSSKFKICNKNLRKRAKIT